MNLIKNFINRSTKVIVNLKGKYILISFRFIILFLVVFIVLYGDEGLLKSQGIKLGEIRWILIFSALQLLSNIILVIIQKKIITIGAFFYDIALVSLVLYWSQGFNNDLFIIYFLVIFSTVIFRNPSMSFVVGGLASLLYGSLFFTNHSLGDLLQPTVMFRFPLLLIVSFFSSIIAQDVGIEISTLEKAFNDLEIRIRERTADLVAEIEERKKSEDALRESEEQYRRIAETAEEGIWVSDTEGRSIFINHKMADMLGYTVREMAGQNLITFMDEDNRVIAEAYVKRCQQGIRETHDSKFRRKDGTDLYTICATNPIFDKNGIYAGALTMITDITERKLIEEQLHQSQKMEAVGRLAGGIAHDFNNLLTVIIGNCDIILSSIDETNPFRRDIKEIRKSSDHAASLTRQLLAFSRKQMFSPKVINLNSIVHDTKKMLGRVIGEDIKLEIHPAQDLEQIEADPSQIQQIILNLAVNARDAMPKGGTVTIETSNIDFDEPYDTPHFEIKPGSYVMLAVSDTGFGIDKETQNHIFEPFFTTKESGKGTGLGLSTVYGIVKQSEGNILVYSEVGHGTTFKIYLPRIKTMVQEEEKKVLLSSYKGTETVLVVEDEGPVRRLVCRVLKKYGYKIIQASNGTEALSVFHQHKDQIDLLLTDSIMPEMNGHELAGHINLLSPRTQVIFMSGYIDRVIIPKDETAETNFIQKPFTAEALAQKIREVLEPTKTAKLESSPSS